jgi:regulator of sigma E protease
MAWLLTIVGILLLIVLHELGHFSVAKAVGMRVERFSVFFPPSIFKVRRGETEYAIGAVPAGGYVKITGMTWEEIEGMDLRIASRAYCMQAPWKRAVVILAGPVMNILLAFVLFWLVLFSGDFHGAVALGNLDPAEQTLLATNSVDRVSGAAPAHGVLRRGDVILAVDGSRTPTVAAVEAGVSGHRCAGTPTDGCRASTPVRMTVRRDGRVRTLSVYPRYDGREKRMLVGFRFGLKAKPFTALDAAGASARDMWHVTERTVTGLGEAFTSSEKRKELHSIVGITEVAHETVVAGAGYALVFTGFFSLVLAVINLFPFLPLDGGHLVWSLAEKARGRRIQLATMYRYSSVGIVLMIFLFINGLSNDLTRLTG